MRVEDSVLVAATPDALWEIATDPTLGPQWNPNVTELRDFTGLPIHVGSTWTQIVKILGRPTQMRATVTTCDPPRQGVVKLIGPGNPTITTTIVPEGAGSRLSQIMEIGESRGLGGLAAMLAGPTVERELHQALIRQKQYAERQTEDSTQ
ncbi:MAG TPA: SRPBCC family protein [Chloroflexota bacterium]|nr:SRPBCC family protein [Chloroflexota bacterium]